VLCRWSGHDSALIQLEGHGRETLFDDIDLTRSVGWFTSAYPLRLTPLAEQGASIKAIKEQLRGMPHKGLGYGVLRYLADDLPARPWRAAQRRHHLQLPRPVRPELCADALFHPLDEPAGLAHDPDAPLPNG
jgi:hypothetical protein